MAYAASPESLKMQSETDVNSVSQQAQIEPDPAAVHHPIDIALDAAIDKDMSAAGKVAAMADAEKKWNEELNKYYKLLMEKLDKNAQTSLKDTQNIWIKFRDAEFKLLSDIYSKKNDDYRSIAASMHMQIVKARAVILRNLYDELYGVGKDI